MTKLAVPHRRAIQQDTSAAVLAAAVEENSIAYWRICAPRLPDGDFHEGDDLIWFTTEFATAPWFNQVLRTRLAPEDAEARIEETRAMFSERGHPMLWSVESSAQPADLEARLQRRGLERAGGVLTGMALGLDSLPDRDQPEGLKIQRVDNERSLERWLQAYVEGFGMAEAAARPFFDLYRAIGFDEESPFRHYVGTLNGETVASSTLFLGAGVASIWHVGTVPRARRQGIGAAMTLAPLRDARDLGVRAGVLGSSEVGLSVYEKLGFQTFGRIVQYKWTLDS